MKDCYQGLEDAQFNYDKEVKEFKEAQINESTSEKEVDGTKIKVYEPVKFDQNEFERIATRFNVEVKELNGKIYQHNIDINVAYKKANKLRKY